MGRRIGVGRLRDLVKMEMRCRCGNHATSWLEIHAVGCCTPERQTVESLQCNACLERSIASADSVVGAGDASCETCGLPFVTLSDIIVRHSPLDGGAL